jgi:hypothetical protein
MTSPVAWRGIALVAFEPTPRRPFDRQRRHVGPQSTRGRSLRNLPWRRDEPAGPPPRGRSATAHADLRRAVRRPAPRRARTPSRGRREARGDLRRRQHAGRQCIGKPRPQLRRDLLPIGSRQHHQLVVHSLLHDPAVFHHRVRSAGRMRRPVGFGMDRAKRAPGGRWPGRSRLANISPFLRTRNPISPTPRSSGNFARGRRVLRLTAQIVVDIEAGLGPHHRGARPGIRSL